MGSIGKALSSAMTPAGTNAAKRDASRKGDIQKAAGSAFSTLTPTLQSQAQFSAGLEPLRQREAWNAIHAATPYGVETSLANFRRRAIAEGLANLPAMQQALSAGGAGIGTMQGAATAALNDANSRANELMAWYATPEGKRALAQQRALAIAQGQALPILPDINALGSIVYGRPAPQVGPSPLASIAGMATSFLPSTGLFGGGGGASPIPGASNTASSGWLPGVTG